MAQRPQKPDKRDHARKLRRSGALRHAKNILSEHARFLLDRAEAKKIVADMKA
jgi:serine/threonine-protein kinase HipA